MSFTCGSASFLGTDGYDNFHTANALKTVDAKNAVHIHVCSYTNCVQTKLGQHLTHKHFPLVFAQILNHICFGNVLSHFIITFIFFFYRCSNERVYCQEYLLGKKKKTKKNSKQIFSFFCGERTLNVWVGRWDQLTLRGQAQRRGMAVGRVSALIASSARGLEYGITREFGSRAIIWAQIVPWHFLPSRTSARSGQTRFCVIRGWLSAVKTRRLPSPWNTGRLRGLEMWYVPNPFAESGPVQYWCSLLPHLRGVEDVVRPPNWINAGSGR